MNKISLLLTASFMLGIAQAEPAKVRLWYLPYSPPPTCLPYSAACLTCPAASLVAFAACPRQLPALLAPAVGFVASLSCLSLTPAALPYLPPPPDLARCFTQPSLA